MTDALRALPAPPLTLREVAEHLSCSVRTIEREISAGRLPVIRVRGLRRVDPVDLAAYLAQSRLVENPCRSGNGGADIRSELRSLADSALNALSPPAPVAPTRKRSRLRSHAARSTMRLVEPRNG